MKYNDIITQYFKNEKIGEIDIILHNSKQSKVFRKLLTKSIKYHIPYFKSIKKGKVLRSNEEIITQCYQRKSTLIEEFSQKICIKTNGIKKSSQINSIIDYENKKLQSKLKDIDLVISILDEVYDTHKLNQYFMKKIKDRKKIEIDIVDIGRARDKSSSSSEKKTPLFINKEELESVSNMNGINKKYESDESSIEIISEETMKGGNRYNINYLAEYSNQVESA